MQKGIFGGEWKCLWLWCFAVVFTGEIIHGCFRTSGKSRQVVLLALAVMQSYCLFTGLDKKELRTWVPGGQDHSDTKVLLTLLLQEESTCEKGVTVTFPCLGGCCTCWCLSQYWNTASNTFFYTGNGAKWTHFTERLTVSFFILACCSRTDLKSSL